jgi:hypothetical protein
MTGRQERMNQARAAGAPCPDCGALVRRGAVLCGWCYGWRPGIPGPRTPARRDDRPRTPGERRTRARLAVFMVVLAGASAGTHDARAGRISDGDVPAARAASLASPPAAVARRERPAVRQAEPAAEAPRAAEAGRARRDTASRRVAVEPRPDTFVLEVAAGPQL